MRVTPCQCPLAGFCERHKLNKSPLLHHKCQTDERFWASWEQGRGPAKEIEQTEVKAARKRKVEAAREQQKRLISWLQFYGTTFRPEDKGIGDTAHWLMKKSYKSKDANAVLERLLKQCSCSRADAVDRLNKKFPY
jgi:hypothetical protein